MHILYRVVHKIEYRIKTEILEKGIMQEEGNQFHNNIYRNLDWPT